MRVCVCVCVRVCVCVCACVRACVLPYLAALTVLSLILPRSLSTSVMAGLAGVEGILSSLVVEVGGSPSLCDDCFTRRTYCVHKLYQMVILYLLHGQYMFT